MFFASPCVYQLEYLVPLVKQSGLPVYCLLTKDPYEAYKLRQIERTYNINVITDKNKLIAEVKDNPETCVVPDSLEAHEISYKGGIFLSHGAALKSILYSWDPASQHGHQFSKTCSYGKQDLDFFIKKGYSQDKILKIKSPKYDLDRINTRNKPFILYCPTWNGEAAIQSSQRIVVAARKIGIDLVIYPHPLTRKLAPKYYSKLEQVVGKYFVNDVFSFDLLRDCTVCVSDISSLVMDAIYLKKHVLCYTSLMDQIKKSFINPFIYTVHPTITDETLRTTLANMIHRPKVLPSAEQLFWNNKASDVLKTAIGGLK